MYRKLFRRRGAWLFLICVTALGAYELLFKSSDAESQAAARTAASARAVPVMAVAAKTTDMDVTLSGLGSVMPITVTVKSRVDGQLMKVLFQEGQTVKAGDVLAVIDPRPYQVQLNQAEGQMARDQALLKNAQLDLARYRQLFTEDSIAKQQLDTQASLVRQYEGAIKVDRGQIDNAKLQLIYSRITAPIGGRLGLRQVDPGNIVHATDQNGLVVITQLQPISVVFTISEDNIPDVIKKLQSGATMTVDAYDRSGKTKLASGVLSTIDNQIDPTTGTVKLKAEFANQDYNLFSNQFVNVRLLLDVKHDVTVVPNAAIQRGDLGTFVYVVQDDSTVSVRPVKLGPIQESNIAIHDGLVSGERVVVDGADKLREGAKIEIIARDETSTGIVSSDKNSKPRPHNAIATTASLP